MPYGSRTASQQPRRAQVSIDLVVLTARQVRLCEIAPEPRLCSDERRVYSLKSPVQFGYRVVVAQHRKDVAAPSFEVRAIEEDAQHVGVPVLRPARNTRGRGVERPPAIDRQTRAGAHFSLC